MRRCPSGHVTTGFNFCTQCGEPMVEIPNRCTKCHEPITLEQKFCGECGAPNDTGKAA